MTDRRRTDISLAMRKVAVFGNAGGGKSALARRLAKITGLPLYVTDIFQFPNGRYQANEADGGKLSREMYEKLHNDIIGKDDWIIDGFDRLDLAWKRFDAADTLIHVDLPIAAHYWGITKRLAQGLFKNPAGWPEKSPVLRSSLDSYRVVWRCHTRLTPRYRRLQTEMPSKTVYRLKSYSDISNFLRAVSSQGDELQNS